MREERNAYAEEMRRLLAPPPCFSLDEVTWLLRRVEQSMPGRNPEGQALITKMRRILTRDNPVSWEEYRAVSKRLRKES